MSVEDFPRPTTFAPIVETLAAAIDLGQKYVPVETGYCEPDSGSWGRTRERGWF